MSDDWKAELDSAIDKASAVLRDKQDNASKNRTKPKPNSKKKSKGGRQGH